MARRIYISNSAFRVAIPGVDAASAGWAQMLFDGFDDYVAGIYTSGLIAAGSFNWVASGTGQTASVTIPFNKTFATFPKFLWAVHETNGWGGFAPDGYYNNGTQSGINGTLSGGSVQYGASISTSSITVTGTKVTYSGTPLPYAFDVAYLVFQH